MRQYLKKNGSFILMLMALAVLLFVPNAKAFVLKGLLHTGIFNAAAKKENFPAVNNDIATLSFIDKTGNRLLAADLKGKIIFINFWATWCPPCIAEMGSIQSLYSKLQNDARFVFVMVDADNNFPQSMAFMQAQQYSLPVYQVTGPVSANLFSGTLPTTLIIDAQGRLVKKHEGHCQL